MKPIWFPLFGAAFLGLFVYVIHRNWPWFHDGAYKWIDLCFGCFISLVFLVIGGLASLGLAAGLTSLISSRTAKVWHEYGSWKMVSMRNADGISGSISGGLFMLSGHVGSENVYFYYTLNQDGSFQPGKWTANSLTSIYEEERKDGKIIQYDIHLKHENMNWIAWPDDRLKMEFHIPKGSLQQTFKVH